MTIFLIVSYAYPNAQHLRPVEFPRDNIFTDVVRWLYKTDTPTNILPSIHVFNSLAHPYVTDQLPGPSWKEKRTNCFFYSYNAYYYVHYVPEAAFCD